MSFVHWVASTQAWGVALACVLVSIALTVHQVYGHLTHYNQPRLQRYICRVILMVPVYAFCSWLSLTFRSSALVFDTLRDCYEAFVIYNFLYLCLMYLGGDSELCHKLEGREMPHSYFWCTCCLTDLHLGGKFLRRMKQGTLQFVIMKPMMAVISLACEASGRYEDGHFSADGAYTYVTIVYNISISVALYCLILFYLATAEFLAPFRPILKFLIVKAVIFFSFWQSVVLAALVKMDVIQSSKSDLSAGELATTIQNWLICVEMVLFALGHYYAFPWKQFKKSKRVETNAKTAMGNVLSVKDIYEDTLHSFGSSYKNYMRQSERDDLDASADGLRASADAVVPLAANASPPPATQPGKGANILGTLFPSQRKPKLPSAADEDEDDFL